MEQYLPLSLDTPRLVLRDFINEDRGDVHALRSDPEVARFMDHAPETPEQSRDWLTGVISHNRERPRVAYNLAVVHRAEGRVIGWIGIGPSSRHPGEGEFGFGYMLNRGHWGRGYATEAGESHRRLRLSCARLPAGVGVVLCGEPRFGEGAGEGRAAVRAPVPRRRAEERTARRVSGVRASPRGVARGIPGRDGQGARRPGGGRGRGTGVSRCGPARTDP